MKTVTVQSKLKILAFRPEEQQTDMTSVYETFFKTVKWGMCLLAIA